MKFLPNLSTPLYVALEADEVELGQAKEKAAFFALGSACDLARVWHASGCGDITAQCATLCATHCVQRWPVRRKVRCLFSTGQRN